MVTEKKQIWYLSIEKLKQLFPLFRNNTSLFVYVKANRVQIPIIFPLFRNNTSLFVYVKANLR